MATAIIAETLDNVTAAPSLFVVNILGRDAMPSLTYIVVTSLTRDHPPRGISSLKETNECSASTQQHQPGKLHWMIQTGRYTALDAANQTVSCIG
jgi:hypothetical protein